MGINGAIFVAAGDYEVGSDDIPNAGPKHIRRLAKGFWIDRKPVGYRLFEKFVIQGGYVGGNLWKEHTWETYGAAIISVDDRCHQVCAATRALASFLVTDLQPSGGGLTGVNWFEAWAICSQSNARLPFEVEWEIAARIGGDQGIQFECLEEWTADAYSPQFWRADFARRGVHWSGGSQPVTVRGNQPSEMFRHVASRRGRAPGVTSSFCSFRRVWDHEPAAAILEEEVE